MATLQELKLRFYDAKNRLTGKQAVINEYNALTSQIRQIADTMPSEAPFRAHVLRRFSNITEENLVLANTAFSAFYVARYNPLQGKRIKTRQKIQECKELLQEINTRRCNQNQR